MPNYILVTPNVENGKLSVNKNYLIALKDMGVTPIICDYSFKARDYLSIVKGVLLTGGGDLGSSLIREPIDKRARDIIDERDEFEKGLIIEAIKNKISILGICRGAQVLNCALGGTIKQHIDFHIQNKQRNEPSHNIKIKKESLLYDILKKEEISVNSFHHQCVLKVAKELKASAIAEDSIIEAIEGIDKDYFLLALQWHPEAMKDEYSKLIFKRFCDKCKR